MTDTITPASAPTRNPFRPPLPSALAKPRLAPLPSAVAKPLPAAIPDAWIAVLRAEVLQVRGRRLAAVARVGVWLATYAGPDGSSARPSIKTLAALSGCPTEHVAQALSVLTAAGLLTKTRRPHASDSYQLVLPTAAPDWAAHFAHLDS